MFIRVDLPDPEVPTIDTYAPSSISRLIPRRATARVEPEP